MSWIKNVGSFISKTFNRSDLSDKLKSLDKQDLHEAKGEIAVGAGVGAVAGGVAGYAVARSKISQVPVEKVTLTYEKPVTQRELAGHIPSDYYDSGLFRPSGYGRRPDEAVFVTNPVRNAQGEAVLNTVTRTFQGHGKPEVNWEMKNIVHRTLQGYNVRVTEDTESVYSHTEYSTSVDCVNEYNSDGTTSRDCKTTTSSDRIYKDVTVGYDVDYDPNFHHETIGSVNTPKVTFNHGINVAGHIVLGAGLGMVLGGLAGGALYVLQKQDGEGAPKPAPPAEPAPPANPAPPTTPPEALYGGVERHAHGGQRHSHAGGDRWHNHGCPTPENPEPFNAHTICFKEESVPLGYKKEEAIECDKNGTICFIQQGHGSEAHPVQEQEVVAQSA